VIRINVYLEGQIKFSEFKISDEKIKKMKEKRREEKRREEKSELINMKFELIIIKYSRRIIIVI